MWPKCLALRILAPGVSVGFGTEKGIGDRAYGYGGRFRAQDRRTEPTRSESGCGCGFTFRVRPAALRADQDQYGTGERMRLEEASERPGRGGEIRDGSSDAVTLSPCTFHIPSRIFEKQDLVILTTITVYDSIVLGDYDSGLTYPMILPGSIPDQGEIEFVYRLGRNPGLTHRFCSP